MSFLLTFYSHYQAIKARRNLKEKGVVAKLISVPRILSSSCGTALTFDGEASLLEGVEREGVYQIKEGGYSEWSD